MEKSKKRLGEILLDDGILTRESLEEALNHQKLEGGMIGQILVKMGYISEDNLIAALGKQMKLPYLPLMNYAVNQQAVLMLDEKTCRGHMVMAFDADEKKIFLVVADPFDTAIIETIAEKTKLRPQVFLATPTEIINMVDMMFSSRPSTNAGAKKGA